MEVLSVKGRAQVGVWMLIKNGVGQVKEMCFQVLGLHVLALLWGYVAVTKLQVAWEEQSICGQKELRPSTIKNLNNTDDLLIFISCV